MKVARILTLLIAAAMAAIICWNPTSAEDKQPKKPRKAAVARARKTLNMLDAIYKNAVVLITDKYVHDEDDFPAGSAAVALFDRVSKTGSHTVRLIDVTGEPYDPDNVAKDDFEKGAVKKLKGGAAVHEQVVEKDGKHYLRAVTAVPVVMKKCVMCHEHYKEVKDGAAIGGISYTIPIE